ncbi:helix-turn-helix domain-containing protein [Dehalobacter sp. DCM]|uniref:PucR family transcriptional regulator n=1 Tax=Dehalobacter sp. DCM TaxID=2907827 RepID=UPI0030816274|nr:helix-turn-helix domain-containing protein [Dehalobacter sp. DCM]
MEDQLHALLSTYSMRLMKTLSKENSLQSLVELGTEMLGNPLTVTDIVTKVIAQTATTHVTDDPVWNTLNSEKYFDFETFSYYAKNRLGEETEKHDKPFYWSDPYCKYRRLMNKITIGGKTLATIAVCAHNRDFKKEDEAILSLLCDAFAIELQKDKYYQFSQGLLHQGFLQDLIDGKYTDERLIIERMKVLNLNFKSKFFVISLDTQYFNTTSATLPYMRDTVESKLVNAKAVIYNNNVVILASCENEMHFLEIQLNSLKEILKKNNMQVGVSRSFTHITEVKDHYLESVEAIRLGNILNKEHYFYRYENYILYDLISNYSRTDKCRRLIHHALIKLIEYDKENGTDYVQSLYNYIYYFKNIKDSAEALNIHRNTMFHRVEKIERLLNVDLNDTDVVFQLYLSYKILEYCKNSAT